MIIRTLSWSCASKYSFSVSNCGSWISSASLSSACISDSYLLVMCVHSLCMRVAVFIIFPRGMIAEDKLVGGCEEFLGYGSYGPMLELISLLLWVVHMEGDSHSLGLEFYG